MGQNHGGSSRSICVGRPAGLPQKLTGTIAPDDMLLEVTGVQDRTLHAVSRS